MILTLGIVVCTPDSLVVVPHEPYDALSLAVFLRIVFDERLCRLDIIRVPSMPSFARPVRDIAHRFI